MRRIDSRAFSGCGKRRTTANLDPQRDLAVGRDGVLIVKAQVAKGLTISTPQSTKSRTLRVATT